MGTLHRTNRAKPFALRKIIRGWIFAAVADHPRNESSASIDVLIQAARLSRRLSRRITALTEVKGGWGFECDTIIPLPRPGSSTTFRDDAHGTSSSATVFEPCIDGARFWIARAITRRKRTAFRCPRLRRIIVSLSSRAMKIKRSHWPFFLLPSAPSRWPGMGMHLSSAVGRAKA